MVSLLDGELRARAAQMVESLKRSREAADYGSASAAFFVAIEAKAAQAGRGAVVARTRAGASAMTAPPPSPARAGRRSGRRAACGGAGRAAGAARERPHRRAARRRDREAHDLRQHVPASALRPEALYQLGELLIRRADEQFAAAQRDAAQSANAPDRPDYAPAIARYRDLITKYPKFDRIDAAAYTLGTLLSVDQSYADAAKMFTIVTAIPASHFRPEAFFRLGDADFELAIKARGDARRTLFVQAATAYDSATHTAPAGGDIYYLALYKLGWSYYNQATKQGQPEYQRAVDVFGRLVTEYDALSPAQQARLGLRRETIDYMAVSLTQVGGAAAAGKYFEAHPAAAPVLELTVLRRLAASLRDQGDYGKAVTAYQEIQTEGAHRLDGARRPAGHHRHLPEPRPRAGQGAGRATRAGGRLRAGERRGRRRTRRSLPAATAAREQALRQSAEYALSVAQRKKEKDPAVRRAKYAEAAVLYSQYITEFATSDSAQVMAFYAGESYFGAGDFVAAGQAYSLAGFFYRGKDAKLADKAGQDAIVAYDSATAKGRGDRAVQDSLFASVAAYVNAFPREPGRQDRAHREGEARVGVEALGRHGSDLPRVRRRSTRATRTCRRRRS